MNLRLFGLIGLSALALAVLAAPSAWATTLEVNGVTKAQSVTILASLEPETSVVFSRTDGTAANTCRESHFHGSTSTFTGSKVTGALTTKYFAKCDFAITTHKPGQFYIEHIAGTTDGTVYFENTEITVETAFGFTVNCKSGEGTHVGRLTGKSSGLATFHFHATFNCGFLLPSATWAGKYWITSPGGLGVSA